MVFEATVAEVWRIAVELLGTGVGFLERGARERGLLVVVPGTGLPALIGAVTVGLFGWDSAAAAVLELIVEGPFRGGAFCDAVLDSKFSSKRAIVF